MKYHTNHKVRKVEIVPVIRVVNTRGLGVHPSAIREVISYWTLEGEKLFEIDTCPDEAEEIVACIFCGCPTGNGNACEECRGEELRKRESSHSGD